MKTRMRNPRIVATALITLAIVLMAAGVHAKPSPAEPAAEIMPFVSTYLGHLAAGRIESALAMTDLRGMQSYLVARRVADMKKVRPEMTAEELAEREAGLRENEARLGRIREVTQAMLLEQNATGMTWEVQRVVSPGRPPNAFMVFYLMKRPNAQPEPMRLGIYKVGPQWYVAPHLEEQIAMLNRKAQVEPPAGAVSLGDGFWALWKTGELEKAFNMLAPQVQKQVTLLNFLETAQQIIVREGLPETWKILSCVEESPAQYGIAYELKCVDGIRHAYLGFLESNDQWLINGIRFPPPIPR